MLFDVLKFMCFSFDRSENYETKPSHRSTSEEAIDQSQSLIFTHDSTKTQVLNANLKADIQTEKLQFFPLFRVLDHEM